MHKLVEENGMYIRYEQSIRPRQKRAGTERKRSRFNTPEVGPLFGGGKKGATIPLQRGRLIVTSAEIVFFRRAAVSVEVGDFEGERFQVTVSTGGLGRDASSAWMDFLLLF